MSDRRVAVEVIVVDDASPDGTAKVGEALTARDDRVRFMRRERNGGPAATRNTALDAARGDWIAVLDADDAFAPGRLSGLLTVAKAADVDVVLDNLIEVNVDGRRVRPQLFLEGPEFARPRQITLEDFLVGNQMSAGARSLGYLKPLVRRSFLERHAIKWNESLHNGEDFQFLLTCLLCGASARFHPQGGYLYTRERSGSISHRFAIDHLEALLRAEVDLLERYGAALSPKAVRLLEARRAGLENWLSAERSLLALKGGRFWRAAKIIALRPRAVGRLSLQLSQAARRRVATMRQSGGGEGEGEADKGQAVVENK